MSLQDLIPNPFIAAHNASKMSTYHLERWEQAGPVGTVWHQAVVAELAERRRLEGVIDIESWEVPPHPGAGVVDTKEPPQ